MYQEMLKIRVFEDNVSQLYLSAKMPGLAHLYTGQEAVVGRIADRVVPVDGRPAVQPMMMLSLSFDHHAVDGARGRVPANTGRPDRSYKAVRLTVRIKIDESDVRLERLKEHVSRYCPVDSLVKAAVPDYVVT